MIELLAITDDPEPPAPPVRLVRAHGLGALCAPAGDAGTPADIDALWRHEALVEALMDGRTLLPVRYGTRVAGDEDAVAVLDERREDFVAALDHVRGAVELAVRVRSAGRGAAPDVTAAVHLPLAGLARDCDVGPGDDLLRAAYLVDRDAVETFVALVRRLQERHVGLAILCTGPWPPYSFASGARPT